MNAPAHPKKLLPTLQSQATHALAPLQREFNRLFDELGSGWEALTDLRLAPSMDITEGKDGLRIDLELPGLSRKEVTITVDGDMLTVSGEKKAEKETKDRNFRRVERSYGEFTRSVYLPRSIDAAKLDAVMHNGVLTITAPRRADAKTQSVEIKSA